MKVTLQRIAVVEEATINVPDVCPGCGTDLTSEGAIRENRVCRTVAFSHFDAEARDADVVATDTEDRDVTWYATEWLFCAECDHDLVAAAQDRAVRAAGKLSRSALREAAREGAQLGTCDED